jgi:excisionase family DNA binding protein
MTRLADIAGKATITVPEAGQLLGIGRDAAYTAAGNGQIPTLRLGRSLRVPVPKLLELLGARPEIEPEEGEGEPGMLRPIPTVHPTGGGGRAA